MDTHLYTKVHMTPPRNEGARKAGIVPYSGRDGDDLQLHYTGIIRPANCCLSKSTRSFHALYPLLIINLFGLKTIFSAFLVESVLNSE